MMRAEEFIPQHGGLIIRCCELICADANIFAGGHSHKESCYRRDDVFVRDTLVGELKKLLKKADCAYRTPWGSGHGTSSCCRRKL